MPDLKSELGETGRNTYIPIGVLFSQSGPMSVTEMAHLKGTLMAIEEINKNGGIDGMLLQPIIDDPKSDPATSQKIGKQTTNARSSIGYFWVLFFKYPQSSASDNRTSRRAAVLPFVL